MKIDKKAICLVGTSVWILLSIAYIAIDIWDDFKKEQLNAALQSGYQQGVTDTVNQAITQAENEKCEPFSMYNKDKKIDVINVACLKQNTAQDGGASK
jgi:hypothetical protein